MDEFIARYAENMVVVRSPQAEKLSEALRGLGAVVTSREDGALLVNKTEAAAIGELAAANGIVLHELSPQRGSLEEAFMELTREDVQFHSPASDAQAADAQATPALGASATHGGGA